ncbi:MAG: glutamate-5-semialdehyde dehydrogenase [Candidatus Lambdaproteobacteria bacterium RIFOXYD2_FULL_50_16]|uniref:Gamma-glutamyl phosphate reductase n=1 Tax=Candidatus Lambdaproteobacteria bacterium RIFOXYD2_FULL_50_16 TaxID=1817772 RepID=A0A1F6GEH9_9PROT|nr:MAG: glutamate-5-semialdehyde dehydrogenase [Candidatus Lambdaproteobacteria bacterium RIFOXYD2_FULL_50_16]
MSPITQKCQAAKSASLLLAQQNRQKKDQLLLKIAERLRQKAAAIAQANAQDVAAAAQAVDQGELSPALLARLKLTSAKIEQLSVYCEEVAKLEDPVGQRQFAMELDKGMELERVSCPLGVLAVLFESRPEVVVQVSALCLKSGNGVILKGGSEAARSNRQLYEIIAEVVKEEGLEGAVGLIETRQDVAEILKEDQYLDLIIPRGSNAFVRHIQENSLIPVLGHSEGICNLYIAADANPEMATQVAIDSKTDYPSACNAVENLLFERSCSDNLIGQVTAGLLAAGVELRGCEETRTRAKGLNPASDEDWDREYSELILSVKLVEGLDEAVEFINQHGSGHTDSIVTSDPNKAAQFFAAVDSACVFHNASTRFSDGFVFGLGAEVGISTNKTHARGPVGLEGLVIYKYLLHAEGQVRGAYSGPNAKSYLHRRL